MVKKDNMWERKYWLEHVSGTSRTKLCKARITSEKDSFKGFCSPVHPFSPICCLQAVTIPAFSVPLLICARFVS